MNDWQEYTGLLVSGRDRIKPLRYHYMDDATIEIALTQGKTALIDAEDWASGRSEQRGTNPAGHATPGRREDHRSGRG